MNTLKEKLEDRIDRWATSGKAKSILLHPEDYLKVEKKKDMIETKYNLPVVCLGGNRGIREFLNARKSDKEIEEQELETVDQGDE